MMMKVLADKRSPFRAIAFRASARGGLVYVYLMCSVVVLGNEGLCRCPESLKGEGMMEAFRIVLGA